MNRRNFIKRGALFVPTIFVPKLIRATPANLNAAFFRGKVPASGGGGGGGGAWTLIGTATIIGDGTTTAQTSSAIDTTGANLIVAWIAGADFATLTDNKGNSFTDLTDPSGSPRGGFKYRISPTVGTGHTFTGASGVPVIIQAWKKNSGTPVADVDTGGVSGGGAGWVSGANIAMPSITPTSTADLMLTAMLWDVGSDPSLATVGSSYTAGSAIHSPGNGSGIINMSVYYKVKSDNAAEAPVWHNGGYATPDYSGSSTSFK